MLGKRGIDAGELWINIELLEDTGLCIISTLVFFTPVSYTHLAAGKTDQPMHQALKQKFIEGGAEFMATILLCLIFGLAIAIERIITLSLAQTNTKKLVENVDKALKEGSVECLRDGYMGESHTVSYEVEYIFGLLLAAGCDHEQGKGKN